MKNKLVCILGLAAMSVATMVLMSGCTEQQSGAPAKSYAELQKEHNTGYAKQTVASLMFVRHEASSLCFAYGWDVQGEGGAVLTNVPCAPVEKLLVNGVKK